MYATHKRKQHTAPNKVTPSRNTFGMSTFASASAGGLDSVNARRHAVSTMVA
jgi:hypothetical protein